MKEGKSTMLCYALIGVGALFLLIMSVITEPSAASISVRDGVIQKFPDLEVKFYNPEVGDKDEYKILQNNGRSILYLSSSIEGSAWDAKPILDRITLALSVTKYLSDINTQPNVEYILLRMGGIDSEMALKQAKPTSDPNLLEAILTVISE